jgi:hypothetical protein
VARVVSAATGEPVGTAAEEAARLLDSLGGWFDARTGTAAQPPHQPGDSAAQDPSGSAAQDPSGSAAHDPTCRACPLCRGVAYLQQAHPDVLTHLAGAAQHLVAALRSLAEPPADGAGAAPDGAGPDGSGAAPGAPGPSADPDPARPSRAVRIDVEPDTAPQPRASSATEQEQAP